MRDVLKDTEELIERYREGLANARNGGEARALLVNMKSLEKLRDRLVPHDPKIA